ncbi:MAG: hypothetical protein IPI68_05100 [Chitinophagaceae bacterium]|nr:hypothetical protein [Chitinophagaceae bacterium]
MEKKGLQKFTESKLAQSLPANIEGLLAQIIETNKMSIEDIWTLTEEQKRKIAAVLTAGYLTLKDEDREEFLEKTEPLLSQKSRNEIWERNHYCILNVISWQTIQNRQIPTIKAIADETGLSRVTVTKHLKEYYDSETFKEKETTYKFLREKLLAKVYNYAYDGNMRAAKIFIDATNSPMVNISTIHNQQNNFIQVNGLVITEDQVKRLSEDKLNLIREIIEKNTPTMERC